MPDVNRTPSELPPYHVLITGFGPFSRYTVNPSWLAVKTLHNTILKVDVSIESISPNDQPRPVDSDARLVATREIHITALQVPVTYDAVLSTIPGLHTRPPVLPPSSDPSLPLPSPPADGYGLFLHVGVSDSPLLRLERVGHKFGYDKKDAAGCLAPLICVSPEETRQLSEAQRTENSRLREGSLESPIDVNETPKRGFGKGYESFAEELYTEIDVEGLVHHLKRCGIEHINSSMDAGHYLCDFIYYCSLAESKRSSPKNQVIFLHCPPVDLPLSTEEVTDAIKKSILWLCSSRIPYH